MLSHYNIAHVRYDITRAVHYTFDKLVIKYDIRTPRVCASRLRRSSSTD